MGAPTDERLKVLIASFLEAEHVALLVHHHGNEVDAVDRVALGGAQGGQALLHAEFLIFQGGQVDKPVAAGGIEVFWPLANLQKGYATLPLFLHRLRLGTFVDAGIAGEEFKSENLLVGAGFEFVTSLEIAWGNFSAFRIGVAWPLVYPDFVRDDSPKFVFQLGRPL